MAITTKKVGVKPHTLTHSPRAIVLAGADGIRLRGLTSKIDGDARPKQFSKIFGQRSLLAHTRDRLQPIFSDDRFLFVVTKDHGKFYKEQLADVDRDRVFEQPANRGTGRAVIAAPLQLLEYETDPVIGIFPSDHYYTQ